MRLAEPIRARWLAGEGTSKKVSWLELFFDLVFVAAVAQVASPLHHHYSPGGALRFAFLFVLVWWAWTGHATFATRFHADDLVQRLLTVFQMFLVALMAANATDALDSESSAGFAAAYAVMRLVLVSQYHRVRSIPGAAALSRRHFAGHGFAALLWLASAFVPAPARFMIWGLALVVDLATPWFAVGASIAAPPDGEHLPERFGLFTIILLGESVIAVMHGMEGQEEWSVRAASAAFFGLAAMFLTWWVYFERIKAAAGRRVKTYADAVRFSLWTYAHPPLFVGVLLVAVGLQRVIELDTARDWPASDALMLLCGLGLGILGAVGIASTAGPDDRARAL